MADMPVVCLFGHSFVKRLCNWSGRRGELVVETLGLQDFSQVVAYGQGGLSFKCVLASLDRYMCEICRCHPVLLPNLSSVFFITLMLAPSGDRAVPASLNFLI